MTQNKADCIIDVNMDDAVVKKTSLPLRAESSITLMNKTPSSIRTNKALCLNKTEST